MILRKLLKTGIYSPCTEDKPIKYMDFQKQKSNFSNSIPENIMKKMKEYDKGKSEKLYNELLEKNCEQDQLLDLPEKGMHIASDFQEVKDEPFDEIAPTRDSEIDEQIDKHIAIFETKEPFGGNFGIEKNLQNEVTSSVEADSGNTYSDKSNTAPHMFPLEHKKDGYEENARCLGSLGPNTYEPRKQIIYTKFDGGYNTIDRWNMCDFRNSRNCALRDFSPKQYIREYNNNNQFRYSNEIPYQFTRNPMLVPLNYTPRSANYLTDKLPELLPLDDYEDEDKEEEIYERVYRYNFNQIPDGEGLAEDVLRDLSIATHRKVRGPKNWEFLMRLLADSRANPSLIKWEDQENYTFRLVDPDIIIDIWNSKSKRPPISYNNFARGLRYHYKRGALTLVREHQMVYGCGPEAINFLNKLLNRQVISHSSSSFFRPWT